MDGSRSIPISVIVLTKNEERGLAHTLSRLARFDEIIVVDSNSTDATEQIARSAGARVVQFTWDGNYPKKKQWSLDNASSQHTWVLLLDADEYPSDAMLTELDELSRTLSPASPAAFDLVLSYRYAGRFLRYGHRVSKRSLLDISRARFPIVDDLLAPGIREVEGHYQPEANGLVGKLKAPLLHDDRDPVGSWFERHNRYSDWEAHLRLDAHARRDIASKRSRKGQIFDRVPFKPFLFFLYSYIARLGFLDGRPGFDYAIGLSMYYWQIGLKYRELKRSSGEQE
jgi:glycosyltransferase involved in cell wall biosynthesis